MNTPNIVFLEVEPEDTKTVRAVFSKAAIESEVLSEDEIIKKHKNAKVLCVFIYTKISRKIIENLPNLKFIMTRSVGYDHIDLAAANEKNIPVCNVPDYGSHVIAEHVFALLLSSIRCVKEGDDRMEQCFFDFHGLRGIALKGKKLGIIGTGKIGRNVARIASLGFLMEVIAYDPHSDEEAARENHFHYVDLEKIWKESDFITLHVPLLKNTKHIINKQTIAKMKDGVVLVNTARGGLIDTKSLVAGIKSNKISHAALDVLEHEKNIADNEELIHLPRVITTPHIAFYADDSMRRMYDEAICSIQRFLNGEELVHLVEGE